MPSPLFKSPTFFVSSTKKTKLPLTPLNPSSFKTWIKKQDKSIKARIKTNGFSGQAGEFLVLYRHNGLPQSICIGVGRPIELYDFAKTVEHIKKYFSESYLKSTVFEIKASALNNSDKIKACVSWGLACYSFDHYKKNRTLQPQLIWPKHTDKKRVRSEIESTFLLRNLINMPANDLGPTMLEKVSKDLALAHNARTKVIKGPSLQNNFPLVHAVGKASSDKPRMIEIIWGSMKHPKLCLVGKGVSFDTGGLNIKPTSNMALMKKDMGGAAHVLALAHMIMSMKLPLHLHVFIPAVENSISGNAFRPGDIIKSRSGINIENTNTDAEGRLILADALTAASDTKPDLIIDCATLTGSARAALGHEITAFFCTNDKLATKLQKMSFLLEDPVWQMPLWQNYESLIKSNIADLVNSASTPGDLIYSALFLKSFISPHLDWIHMDMFAWEKFGRPGRPKGGAVTGFRALYALIENKYGQ